MLRPEAKNALLKYTREVGKLETIPAENLGEYAEAVKLFISLAIAINDYVQQGTTEGLYFRIAEMIGVEEIREQLKEKTARVHALEIIAQNLSETQKTSMSELLVLIKEASVFLDKAAPAPPEKTAAPLFEDQTPPLNRESNSGEYATKLP
jgi:hypothetical protein